jgi:hypothetical protein
MSNAELHCAGPNDKLSPCDSRKTKTWHVALVTVFAALGLSLVGVYFLDKNVTAATNLKLSYIEQRLSTIEPSFVAAIKVKKKAM